MDRHRLFCFVVVAAWAFVEKQPLTVGAAPPQSSLQTEAATEAHSAEAPQAPTTPKAAVQARIDALGPTSAQTPEQAELRTTLEQLRDTLTGLEAAKQKHTEYLTLINTVTQRVRELQTQRQTLVNTPPRRFAETTEAQRNEIQTQLRTTQNEIQDIIKETVAGEVRLANIPRELTDQAAQQDSLAKELNEVRADPAPTPITRVRTEVLEARLALQRAETETTTEERDWLLKREPLQDALLSVAQSRLRLSQQELDTVTTVLGRTIEAEQEELTDTATDITRQMQQALDPVEAMQLRVGLETVEIRSRTTEYRRRLNEVRDVILTRQLGNAHIKQNLERFKALVEKYTAGEVVAQRLLILFSRLQRERSQYNVERAVAYEGELRTLNDQLFELEDKLYEFDYEAQHRLPQVTLPSNASVSSQQTPVLNSVQPLLDQQKTALREQQQTLAALGQELTTLIALDGEDKRQLDESYLLGLTTLFWLRDGKPLNWEVLSDMVSGGRRFAANLIQFTQSEFQRFRALAAHNIGLRALAVCLFILLPWLAYRGQRKLHFIITSPLNNSTGFTLQRPWVLAIFILIWAAIWPLYLVLLASLYGSFSLHVNQHDLMPVTQALELMAVFLWLGCVGHGIFRHAGWAERYWGLLPATSQSLDRAVWVVTISAILCFVPRYLLLIAPGDTTFTLGSLPFVPAFIQRAVDYSLDIAFAPGSVAFARFLFLLFQLVVLVLVGVIGRRSGPLTAMVLGTGHQEGRLLWRAWPILHATILIALVLLFGLGLVGYRYAARFLWLRLFASLGVLLGLWLLVVRGLPNFERGARRVFMRMSRGAWLDVETAQTSHALSTSLGFVGRGILLLIAGIVLLAVWGVPVAWVLSSHALWTIVKRTVVIGVVTGVTVFVIRASRLFTTYLLTPPAGQPVESYQASRKVQTLAPLVQTLIQVIVIFAATLLVLEQFGINTGPVLAGAGILGLAVGFASQSLIKDVINGLFILFEDSLSIGDVVKLRNISGQVEKFTLRAVTLRDVSGSVHIIPNSAIDTVTNMTKDYSRYVLDIGVAYGQDIERAVALLKEIGDGLRRDPQYGSDMLEPMEVMGVERFTESAVVIRVRLKTQAMQQWRIGREFNQRMKNVFEEQGIEVPLPQRPLQWGNPVAGS